MTARIPMPKAYGFWNVTTEGDCEGRTTRHLGTHEGFIDEIAFALAKQAYYGLRFDPVDPKQLSHEPTGTEVQISLGIETGTWDLKGAERVNYFRRMLSGRDVIVEDGQYYATVKLISGSNREAQERAKQNVARAAALAKLSPEDRAALGIKE